MVNPRRDNANLRSSMPFPMLFLAQQPRPALAPTRPPAAARLLEYG